MTGPTIRVSRLHFPVTALGPGTRLGLWVQGCPLACPGCMSQHTWDPEGGHDVTVDDLAETWRAALARGADGVTVSGGEPLEQASICELMHSLADARDGARPEADILLYTGYSEREARRRGSAALAAADAVITGRYLASQPTTLIWRGSANQNLIPLSTLGTGRYTPYLRHVPPRPPVQMGFDEAGAWFIGVPRAGDMRLLTAAAQRCGVHSTGTTWEDGTRGRR